MEIIHYLRWVHSVKLKMFYVGVWDAVLSVIMLILNALNMQNADGTFSS